MRIRMKETRRGTEDGYTVREYVTGNEYELAPTERGEELGRVFIREGWAEEMKPAPAPPPSPAPSAPAGGDPPLAAPGPASAPAPAATPTRGSRKGQ